jgi:hypothetical protein
MMPVYSNASELSMRVLMRVSGLSTMLPALTSGVGGQSLRRGSGGTQTCGPNLRTTTPIAKFCRCVGAGGGSMEAP